MPLCGVYRRLACKFSKVSREEIGSATEEEKKNDSATEESFTDCGLAPCKKCGRTKQGSLHIAEDICDRCRNKRSAASKWFGEWPIAMFEDMPEEQQKAFWKGPFWKAVASQAMMHGESIGVDAANSCMGRPLARGKPC